MQFIGIIPARYASTRFPGKPLADIGGKPMIQRVYEQARQALDTVVVATDDERIYEAVQAFGGQVVMTRNDHKCGTDRCLEAYEKVHDGRCTMHDAQCTMHDGGCTMHDEDIIINIQGDEPFIQPEQIEAIKRCFTQREQTQIATLVRPFTEADRWDDLENPNTPKVAVTWDDEQCLIGQARMFSRSIIPYLRGVAKEEWLMQGKHYRHIGMYAYRAEVLRRITSLPQTALEKAESLEQLRWLENGYPITVAVCHTTSIGIDTPEDLEKARRFLERNR